MFTWQDDLLFFHDLGNCEYGQLLQNSTNWILVDSCLTLESLQEKCFVSRFPKQTAIVEGDVELSVAALSQRTDWHVWSLTASTTALFITSTYKCKTRKHTFLEEASIYEKF